MELPLWASGFGPGPGPAGQSFEVQDCIGALTSRIGLRGIRVLYYTYNKKPPE